MVASTILKSALGKLYIPLPKVLQNKKAIVTIKNNDDRCFDYCLVASKIYDDIKGKDKNDSRHYKKNIDKIKTPDGITYPITTNDIPLYEELNDIQINVFSLDGYTDDIEDVRTCINEIYKSNKHRKEVVNMLLIREGDKSHYTYISNLSRLFNSQTCHHSKFHCPHCIVKCYNSIELLNKHVEKCLNYDEAERVKIDVVCECPQEGKNIMKFKIKGNSFQHPFIITADFESTLQKCDDEYNSLSETEKKKIKTHKTQKHLQNSFGLKYNCIHKQYSKPLKIFNSGDPEEVNKQFIEALESYAEYSYKLIQQNKSFQNIKYKREEKLNHFKCKSCYECKNAFNLTDRKRVAHHDHITGDFISSLCSKCNLDLEYQKFVPVYMHNLKGYDSHLFIRALYKYGYQNEEITCIPNNEEKYISFSKKIKVDEFHNKKTDKMEPVLFEIRFLDTIGFMNTGIEKLVENLSSECKTIKELRDTFEYTSEHFTNDKQFELMTKKGIYPYDYIDDFNKMNDTSLPSIDKFYSKLYNSHCSEEDYKTAQLVWETFNCKTFLDYHNIYLASDVLLLTDVWNSFTKSCYNTYKLDPTYYYTLPGFSFDAMLKYTEVELELFTEIEHYEFIESGIRGGLSQISTRYAKANNKYMKIYDPKQEESYIVYLDANNLYGGSMNEYLPYGGFKLTNTNVDEWNFNRIMNIDDEADIGYKFKVDVRIPVEKHDEFNNYVPFPEAIKVKKENLNKWQQENYKQSNISKLCCSFEDKFNYVIDYRYLKLYLSLGCELV